MSHAGPATGEARGGEKADIAQHQKNTNTGLSALSQLSQHEIHFHCQTLHSRRCVLCTCKGAPVTPAALSWLQGFRLLQISVSHVSARIFTASSHLLAKENNNNNKRTKQQNKSKQKNCILHTPTFLCNHCIYVGLTQQYRSPFLTEITNFCHKQENTRTIADIYPVKNKECMWMTKILGANSSSHSTLI